MDLAHPLYRLCKLEHVRDKLPADALVTKGRDHVHSPDKAFMCPLAQAFAPKTDAANEFGFTERTEDAAICGWSHALRDCGDRFVALFFVTRTKGARALAQGLQAQSLKRVCVGRTEATDFHFGL